MIQGNPPRRNSDTDEHSSRLWDTVLDREAGHKVQHMEASKCHDVHTTMCKAQCRESMARDTSWCRQSDYTGPIYRVVSGY